MRPLLPDGAISLPMPRSVRVESGLRLQIGAGPDRGRIMDRRESGALRFRFPRAHGRPPEAILVNVAGGLTGGDNVSMSLRVEQDAALTLTSATAERIYASNDDPVTLSTDITIEGGGTLIWLPQETILHEKARLSRALTVNAASKSHLLMADMVFLGRRASGEGFEAGLWKDRWRIFLDGRLVFADETRLTPASLVHQFRAGTLDGAVALGNLVLRGPDTDDLLSMVRSHLVGAAGLETGATLVDGLIVVRLMARDASILRAASMQLAANLLVQFGMPWPRALAF